MLKRIKWIWNIASVSYLDWLLSTRSVLMAMIIIFIMDDTVLQMNAISQETGYLLNLFEPFIVICNDIMTVVILSVGYVCLMSGFPQIGASSQNMIYRISRTSWLFGQMLFSLMTGVTYLGCILLGSCICAAKYSFISDYWSNYTTLIPQNYPDIAGQYLHHFVEVNVYSQTGVSGAAAYGFFANLLYLLILALIALVFALSGKRFLGFVICFGTIFIGMAFFMLGVSLQWLFPMSNSIFAAHRDLLFDAEIMPIWYSVLYFIILLAALTVFSWYKVKKFPITPTNE